MQIVSNMPTSSKSNITKIEKLDELADYEVNDLVPMINTLIDTVNVLIDRPSRDRGPKSERDMIREDAWRVRFGDLKDASHKDAAKKLGLSYGQVYSARGGYTLKDVTADEFSIEPDTTD